MATVEDVRRIALALPGVVERVGGHSHAPAWRAARGDLAWVRGPTGRDLEQLAGLGRSWPDGEVIGLRVGSTEEAAALVQAEPETFFTIPHFDGYPAVLVRLDRIDLDYLSEVLVDAWVTRVPQRVAHAWLAEHGLT